MSSLDDLFGTGPDTDATQDPTFAILGLVPAPVHQPVTPPAEAAPPQAAASPIASHESSAARHVSTLAATPAPDAPLTRRQLRELEREAERAASRGPVPAAEPVSAPAAVHQEVAAAPVTTIFDAGAAHVASTASAPAHAAEAAGSGVLAPRPEPAPVAVTPVVEVASQAVEEAMPASVVSDASVGWVPGGTPEAALVVPPIEAETNARRRARAKKRFARSGGRLVAARAATAPAARRAPLRRVILRKLMTVGAMVGAGLMMISTSLPANAFYTEPAQAAEALSSEAPDEVQALEVAYTAADAEADAPTLSRDNYTVVSLAEQIFLKYGNRNFAFTNNPNAAIQWPFPIGVPISSGFGERVAPCSFCSSYHQGVDFTPGIGTPIQAIADGTVILVAANNYGFGNHVIIRHEIDGQQVDSVYAHMLFGSIRVVQGQTVRVNDIVGQVGSTGASTGAHLHLEVHINGVAVDPFDWLKAHNK